MLDRQLSHVVEVARTGSFTRAAERIGVTQSGITRSIAELERELGYALFYRTAKGALLTERGRDFSERAGQLLDDARSLMSGGLESGDPYARTLRIGVCPSSLEWRLGDPIAALLARCPTVRVQIVASSLERLVQLLRSGAIDVAVGFEDAFTEWSDIKSERVSEVRGVLYVRKEHPLLGKRAITLADLAKFPCVLPSDAPFDQILRNLFEARGVSWRPHLHVIDNTTIGMRVVATSDAFALTSEAVAVSEGFLREFARVPSETLDLLCTLCCATRSRWEVPKPATVFIALMKITPLPEHDSFA